MAITRIAADARRGADWLARRVDPRRSIAGKFVTAATALPALTILGLAGAVWWVTTEFVATQAALDDAGAEVGA